MRSSIRALIALVSGLLLAGALLLPAAMTVAGHSGTDCGCSTTETSETYSTSTTDSSTSETSTTESTTSTETTGTTTTETSTSETTTTVTRHVTPPPTSTEQTDPSTRGQSGSALVIIGVLGLLGLLVSVLYNPARPPSTGTLHVDHVTFEPEPPPDNHGEGL